MFDLQGHRNIYSHKYEKFYYDFVLTCTAALHISVRNHTSLVKQVIKRLCMQDIKTVVNLYKNMKQTPGTNNSL